MNKLTSYFKKAFNYLIEDVTEQRWLLWLLWLGAFVNGVVTILRIIG